MSNYKYFKIEPGMQLEDIKLQYKKNAKELHPDLHPGKEEEFKEMQGEYEQIINNIKNNVKQQKINLSPEEEAKIDGYFDVLLNQVNINSPLLRNIIKSKGMEGTSIAINKVNDVVNKLDNLIKNFLK